MSEDKIKVTRQEVVRSYAKIWTMPLKIYAIESTKLIIPVGIWDALFFALWELIFIAINFLVPPFQIVPNTIKFLLMPFLLMKFMSLVKLEGKQPHKYFFDLVVFWLSPKHYEYFKPAKRMKTICFKKEKIHFKG